MSHWSDVAPVNEFGPGQSRLVNIEGVEIAVFNLDGQYYAIEDVCSHDGSPMLGCGLEPEEVLDSEQIICPRHGARFCIRTGTALAPPAYEPIATFPIKITNGMVQTRDNRWD
jgi:3-phenylpropionate/trans-cinnamate dioxygenase ferredoxin component